MGMVRNQTKSTLQDFFRLKITVMNMHSIQNEADYKEALKVVSALVDADPKRGTPEADRLEALGLLVEAYERGKFDHEL